MIGIYFFWHFVLLISDTIIKTQETRFWHTVAMAEAARAFE